ncbi:MAG: hypothetical protein WC001_07710 [Desulfurivibrionaceae bacterium]|jgi:hypothetical protein
MLIITFIVKVIFKQWLNFGNLLRRNAGEQEFFVAKGCGLVAGTYLFIMAEAVFNRVKRQG